MKKLIPILLFGFLMIGCNKTVDIDFISKRFDKEIEQIDKIQYNVRNIIQFSSGCEWDNSGFAMIEKDKNDTIFGFSFYGHRNDINRSSLYKDGVGIQVYNEKMKFRQEVGSVHFLGSPGGQMIFKDYFKFDKDYKTSEIIMTDSSYIVKFEFEDDTVNHISEKSKVLELNRKSFLPIKITTSLKPDFGDKTSTVYIFSDIKVNSDVDTSLSDYYSEIDDFEPIIEKKPEPNKILNTIIPSIELKKINNNKELFKLDTDKLVLLDFWEVWCGWCIKSLPTIQEIQNNYSDDLLVIGLVSKEIDNAIKLLNLKEITFLNLQSNTQLINLFNVDSYPRYFLIDKDGIVRKEYFGYSDKIESDIKEILME